MADEVNSSCVTDICVDPLADHPEATGLIACWLYNEWIAASGRTLDEAAENVRSRLNRNDLPLALVARAGELVVGTASLALDRVPNRPQPFPFLASLYVDPAWRRRGIGSLLCARALAEAKRLAISTLFVYTTDQETFYTRRGWRKLTDTLSKREDHYQIVTFMERDVC